MGAYLKYYFGHDGNKLYFNSIECKDDETPVEPADFLKWYEPGDFAPQQLTEDQKSALARSDSPVYTAMFMPRAVTFDVDELLKRCQK